MKSVYQPISKIAALAVTTLGKFIKAARLERNMSQEELATRLNTSRLTVISIEKGNSKVNIGAYFEAAAILGISLLGEDTQHLKENAKTISSLYSILPKRVGRKKELDDDF